MTFHKNLRGLHVGILGGGITGLTSAFYLLRAGAKVTVVEGRPQLGGLATYFNFGKFWWDKFYHCILTSDGPLLQLFDDLGLSPDVRWTETKVGFFADQSLYPMTSSLDFLRFPPLNLSQKARLGLGVLYASRIRDGRPLEKYLASEWLTRVFGQANYRKIWGPLLKCKLGACREEASAAFIWATIARLYSTRENNSSKKECLGYVRGGYRTVVNRLIQEIEQMGGNILTGVPVQQLHGGEGIDVYRGDERLHFDYVIATIPSHALTEIAPQLTPEYVQKLKQVKYLGVVCMALLLKRKLSPYYVTNLTDEDLPFTGVIEMTNLISRDETAGYHLLYLPKYTSPADPLFDTGEDEIWRRFSSGLKRVFPGLDEAEIEKRYLFRERYVQPVPVLNYSDLVPEMRTTVKRLLLANTTQIINSTLNNNAMVRIAHKAVEILREECAAPLSAASRARINSSDVISMPA